MSLLESGAGVPFVAVTDDDQPCYVQWLFSHHDNDFLQRYFHGSFPVLDDRTALLEAAFTPEAHRGKKIMSAAMARIAQRARSIGARHVVTFVGVDNIPSLRGCEWAGFSVYTTRVQRWRMFRPSVTFTSV